MGAYLRSPDFDALVRLHRLDPEAFEETRRRILRAAVDDAPAEHRAALEHLLERIESERSEAASPAEAAQSAFRMMCDSVEQLRDAWDEARTATAGLQAAILIEQARMRRH